MQLYLVPQHVGQVVTTVTPRPKASDNEQPTPTSTNLTSIPADRVQPTHSSSLSALTLCLVGDAERKPGIPSCE